MHYLYFGYGDVPSGRVSIFQIYQCIKNGITFHNFGIRNGTYFQDFHMKYIRSDILFRKIGIRSGILFQKLVQGTGMFLKSRWHVPDQNLVKCTPGNGTQEIKGQ